MRIMRKITILFFALAMFASAEATLAAERMDKDQRIEYGELPAKAREFITEHFGSERVAYAKLDKGLISNEYEVVFESGTKIEFGSEGKWQEIECRTGEVPRQLVPKKVVDYVAKHYPTARITELKHEHSAWEVNLGTGLELTFDKSYKLIDIDD